MKLIKLCFLSLFAMLLTACGGEGSGLPSQPDQPVTILELQLTPARSVIPVGWTQQYTVEALFSDGHTLDVTKDPRISLQSSDTNIATIDQNGLATGITPGEVTITATGIDGAITVIGNASLIVTDATVTSIDITPPQATVPVGISQQYEATAILSDGRHISVTSNPSITWYTSDENIASIDNGSNKGLATGNHVGEVDIIATGRANGNELSGSAKLYVTDVEMTELTVTPPSSTVPIGLSQPYDAIAHFSDGSVRTITNEQSLNWSIKNSNIATIDNEDSKGLATGVTSGDTSITATWTTSAQTLTADASISVIRFSNTFGLEISPEQTVSEGDSTPFRAWLINADGSRLLEVTKLIGLSWQTSDSQIATIQNSRYSTKGWATGVSEGQTTITASVQIEQQSLTAASYLTVIPSDIKIRITPSNICLNHLKSDMYDFASYQMKVEMQKNDSPWVDVTTEPDISWKIAGDTYEQKYFNFEIRSNGLLSSTLMDGLILDPDAPPGLGTRLYSTRKKHWLIVTMNENGKFYSTSALIGAYIEGDVTPLTGPLIGYAPDCPIDYFSQPH